MKTIGKTFVMLFMAWLMQCCHSSSSPPAPAPPTAVQKATALIDASAWKMQSLTIDGIADTTFFKGLIITFTASSFTAVNGAPVWPATETWTFTDANATAIKRSDNLIVNVDNLTSTAMQLSLDWTTTTTEGRKNSVAGKHVFIFAH